ncbi:protein DETOXIFICATION 16-like isoform X2 [Neltuma alba]|uniref:protein DETOXIFICATION 16-like isoform X2 n=1 Tax=Neltuma alba TaxID=207710 RepID=UPI0010A51674|nr:protein DETOXIFICATION 16-like isoform X2 [Prosopis alba]
MESENQTTTLSSPLIQISGEDGLFKADIKRNKPKRVETTQVFEEVRKQLWLAGPLISVNVLNYCLQVISVMFVGHQGELALSGASMATSFASVTGFSLLVGMASALDTLCGQSYGAKQHRKLGMHMQRAMVVLMIVSVPLAIVWAKTGSILIALGQDPEISAEAGQYANFMIPCLFAYGLLQCLNRFLQSQNFSPSCAKAWPGFSKEALHGIPTFFRLAIPSAVMVCLEAWSFEMMVLLSGLLPNPKLETSVLSICLNTASVVWMIPFGLSGAVSTRVSNELGAGHPRTARLAVRVVLVMAIIEGILVGTMLILVRNIWGNAYSNEVEVVKYVATMMPILAISNFVDGLQCVLSGTARGCGWQKIGAFVNLGSYYLVGIPLAVMLAFVLHIGGKGLWLGIISALLVQVLSLLTITIRSDWDQEAVKAKDRVYDSTTIEDIVS